MPSKWRERLGKWSESPVDVAREFGEQLVRVQYGLVVAPKVFDALGLRRYGDRQGVADQAVKPGGNPAYASAEISAAKVTAPMGLDSPIGPSYAGCTTRAHS